MLLLVELCIMTTLIVLVLAVTEPLPIPSTISPKDEAEIEMYRQQLLKERDGLYKGKYEKYRGWLGRLFPRYMMSEFTKTVKQTLRLNMKETIAAITAQEKDNQSEYLTAELLKHSMYRKSSRISIYINMDDEVRTHNIIKNIFETGKKCFIPWYNRYGMTMVHLRSLEELKTLPRTKWNIPQPREDEEEYRENALSLSRGQFGGLDLIIVPGLAFTKQGQRLGRGKGYYDTFLEECYKTRDPPVTIALAFREQIVPHIPVHEHDYTLNQIIYPLS